MLKFWLLFAICCVVLVPGRCLAQTTNPPDEGVDARSDTATISGRLASKDPLERRRAAEALAKLAAVDQKKLVEGYRVQEKNKEVRLALDWALYRMGKQDALYRVVRELDSDRHDQAVAYLTQLESASTLYGFLKPQPAEAKITVGLLEALGVIGDSESLEVIKPFYESVAPGVAAAAETATDQIERRVAENPSSNTQPSRPRTVTSGEKP